MNPKSSIRILLAVLISNIQTISYSQTSGLPILNEVARDQQLNNNSDSLSSFCVRPIYYSQSFSALRKSFAQSRFFRAIDSAQESPRQLLFLPLTLQQQYNTHHPYGWNDGSMIPAKGYQAQLSAGMSLKNGIISMQLQPEMVFAQNTSFPGFSSKQNDSIWRSYYIMMLNVTDAPERFGNHSYKKILPGQSYVRINYRKLSLGLSTENLWWGPGIRNSLLMSNNAPGFLHLSFNSSQPVTSSVGSFEWQIVAGKLKGSGMLPGDTSKKFDGQSLYVPKQNGDRYINGFVVAWQPKWTKGLFIGFSRVFYQYLSDVPSTFDGYMPIIGKLFKGGLKNEDEKKRDQMLSVFLRLVLPKEKAELYAEFGRNDHSANAQDLLLEPEHSRAYIVGFAKTFDTRKKALKLFSEIINLQMPSTLQLRAQESWYTHYQVRHGYTNLGQIIGAGIGAGASSQTVGLQWGEDLNKITGSFERIVRNNDFYYNAFTPLQEWDKHWVDLSLNVNKCWIHKNIVYNVRLSFIHSINYEWYYKSAENMSAGIGISYLF
jgi:hypothetical protein